MRNLNNKKDSRLYRVLAKLEERAKILQHRLDEAKKYGEYRQALDAMVLEIQGVNSQIKILKQKLGI